MFVTFIVRFLLPCVRRANSLNDPYLHSLASCVLNSLFSSNRSPVVGSRMALILIMSDMNVYSRADR